MSYSKGRPPTEAVAEGGIPGAAVFAEGPDAGVAPAIAREVALVRVSMEHARRYPRVLDQCIDRLIATCSEPRFAADYALWQFERGDKTLKGCSIDVARVMAQIWGNISYGLSVIEDKPDSALIEGWAMDLQSVQRIAYQAEIPKVIPRKDWVDRKKVTRWIRPEDPRDLRELMARIGAVLVRNAIFHLCINPVVLDEIQERVEKIAGDEGARSMATAQAKAETLAKMVAAFAKLGVTQAMIEAAEEKPIDQFDAGDVGRLKRVYRSLVGGSTTVQEYFGKPTDVQKSSATGAEPVEKSKGPETLDDLVGGDSTEQAE